MEVFINMVWYSLADGERIALILLPVAVLFIVYALRTYLSRSEKIKTRDAER